MNEQPISPERRPTPHDLHVRAEMRRESGKTPADFLQSSLLAREATNGYLAEGNFAKAAETSSSQMLGLLRLARTVTDPEAQKFYQQQALTTGKRAVGFAEKVAGPDASPVRIPLYTLGKAYESVGDIKNARDAYQRAVDIFIAHPIPTADIPIDLELADMQAKLAAGECKLGNKEHMIDLDEAIKEMTDFPSHSPHEYKRLVWLIGARLSKAELLAQEPVKETTKQKESPAQRELREIQEIIDGNKEQYPDLRLRQADLLRTRQTLGFN